MSFLLQCTTLVPLLKIKKYIYLKDLMFHKRIHKSKIIQQFLLTVVLFLFFMVFSM